MCFPMSLEEWQRIFLINAFNEGMRSGTLGSQPAPWVLYGLQILEAGGELSSEKIEGINRSGGTDYPDPWFG